MYKYTNLFIPLGLLFLALSNVSKQFITNNVGDFLTGFCLGLSLVFNIVGIYITAKNTAKKQD